MAKVRKRTWENKDGKQTAWIADYSDQAGKRHIKTFPTQKAAKTWLVETQHEVKQGVHTPVRTSVTVAEAGESWIAQAETDGRPRQCCNIGSTSDTISCRSSAGRSSPSSRRPPWRAFEVP
jgi:hypothetical protein